MAGGINPKTGRRYDWEAKQAEARKEEDDLKALQQQISLLKRQQKAVEARTKFMTFIKFTSPDPEDPNDVERSKYKNAKHHDAIARVIEEVVEGNIPFLILTCPPRHGKSEIVSRRLPAWFIGRFPHLNGVVATYNDDFAMDFGKDVRGIVKTPQFKQVFPSIALQRGGSAADRLQTMQGGQWSFVGRGGSLTGRGAHCFVAGTMVKTIDGDRQIQTLAVGDKVLAYDRNALCWKNIEAVSHRPAARIFRITTAAGRVVEATADHQFYVDGLWVEAAQLTPGDPLLCAVRGDDNPSVVRRGETPEARAKGLLLLERLLGRRNEQRAARRAALRALRRAGKTREEQRHAGAGQDILLDGVHGGGAVGGAGGAGAFAHEALRAVQRHVRAAKRYTALLFSAVRGQAPCRSDGEAGQPALEGRCVRQSSEAACDAALPGASAYGAGSRWAQVRPVLVGGEAERPSHRREPAEQSGDEPNNGVLALPPASALFAREADVVRSVEDTGRFAPVYDIQVEGAHNFFANEVLVSNCLIIDDLIKDDKEAQSQAIRDQAWNWFTKVAMSRRMGKKLVIMTFTRWHADDPIGRLTDPENPNYNEKLAEKIKIINLPAIAEEDDPLGRQPGEPLWPDGPDAFGLDFLQEQQALDPLGFAALYQQRPSLLDGDLFKREDIRFYGAGTNVALPDDLRIYAASDHAVGTGQRNDPSCFLKIGVDKDSNIYILECVWRKMKADVAVEAMLSMCRGKNKPLLWWAERGHISKSIGPFLRKRMMETGTYVNIREVTPVADKAQRAQSIVGRVAMGKVFFPFGLLWVEKAINEMMAFPNGTHDDFVDALAWIGLGLQSQFAPSKSSGIKKVEQPVFGTLDWVKQADRWEREQRAQIAAGGF